MLDQVVEREGREAAVAMLESYFDARRPAARRSWLGIPPAERLGVVARLLSEEGYMAEALVSKAPATRPRRADRAQLRHSGGGGAVPGDLRGGGAGSWRTCWEPRWTGAVTS